MVVSMEKITTFDKIALGSPIAGRCIGKTTMANWAWLLPRLQTEVV